jgi:flagellar biosynthesis/type III secretory pathway M-ring protein FliF/YscJ
LPDFAVITGIVVLLALLLRSLTLRKINRHRRERQAYADEMCQAEAQQWEAETLSDRNHPRHPDNW